MKHFFNLLKGIGIGAGCILPGISSGVLLVVFGLYDKLIHSVLHFFKDIKNNSKFLFPIVLGTFLGIVLFGNILQLLFSSFPSQTKSIFIGLLLGSLPLLFKQANGKKGFRLRYILPLLVTFFISMLLLYCENKMHFTGNISVEGNFFFFIFSGFCMSIGIVIPGISSTVILMLLGIYPIYLAAVSSLNLPVLLPMALGIVIGGFLFMHLIQFLMTHYFSLTYYGIIGFAVGSTFVLYPTLDSLSTVITSLICLCIGFYMTSSIEKIKGKTRKVSPSGFLVSGGCFWVKNQHNIWHT